MMNELRDLAIRAHGGMAQWKTNKSIGVEAIISGQLLEAKGFHEHLFTRIEIDTGTPRTTLTLWRRWTSRCVHTEPGLD
jgi:hypothetical protein